MVKFGKIIVRVQAMGVNKFSDFVPYCATKLGLDPEGFSSYSYR